MRIFWSFLIVICFLSCDDGDIVVEDFDFGDNAVQACLPSLPEGNRSYLFYKVDNTNNESFAVGVTTGDEIRFENGTYGPYNIGSTNFVDYRGYTDAPGNDYFCNDIPPSSPQVTEQFISEAGQIFINTTTRSLDDEDGIPADLEPEGQDTDGDGIEDRFDSDDDGDNVPTIQEGVVIIDGQISDQSRDTDEDGTPDYLDTDDDGDDTPTIQEDLNGNLDPTDDDSNEDDEITANYLDASVSTAASPAIEQFRFQTSLRTAQLAIQLVNIVLREDDSEIIFDQFDYGTYVTPNFRDSIQPMMPGQ
jgi:hypothetical protein